MEKKLTRDFNVNYNLDWTYGVEIKKIREDLDAIEKLGATHVNIESSVEYDGSVTTIEVISRRIESDEEHKARIEKENQRFEDNKRRDLEQLARLKKMYGV